ncbi:S-adenosyl-L-homocysteine hydrolase [Cedecea neteri]|uniref:S-adenosyl-L-homocysteine hydrolase n=1 Tax=Cedecea neteri TaxID=158822 RepID=A0A2X2T5H4_9ENTR|nr:S-adenosyl-L-homocysteine hydrolase [Cedecea neteri]
MSTQSEMFNKEIAWSTRHMVRTLKQVQALPDLSHVRIACNMHLDLKMIPLVEGLLKKNAKVFLTTCNPTTVQDDVVAYLVAAGAEACAWRNMSDADWRNSWGKSDRLAPDPSVRNGRGHHHAAASTRRIWRRGCLPGSHRFRRQPPRGSAPRLSDF